jgi:uncharacterized protein (TIRG00374 family)
VKKWLKNILGLAILAFLLLYLFRHWDELKSLELGPVRIVLMYGLWFVTTFVAAVVVQLLLRSLKTETRFWDMFWLGNAALLLNYAPMKFGTLFRAAYLKRHYNLPYSHFATFFMYIMFLMTAAASAISLAVLVTLYGLSGYESRILAAVFLFAVAGSLVFLFVRLPLPGGKSRFSKGLRNFLAGRGEISRDRNNVLLATVLLAVNFLFEAARIGIIYYSMGERIHPLGYLILGAMGYVVFFIGLTPGALGIREAVLGFSAVVLGVSYKVGLQAALIDRLVTFSYAFLVGGGSALYLWRKSPADFKEVEETTLVQ